jgi:hypothetical protein
MQFLMLSPPVKDTSAGGFFKGIAAAIRLIQ